jgi:hypothetical protein
MRDPNLERKKNEKHTFLGLNRPFIEVAHFENTITNEPEILPESKKNNSKYSKMIYFNLKLANLN